jgi:hypothetical protein
VILPGLAGVAGVNRFYDFCLSVGPAHLPFQVYLAAVHDLPAADLDLESRILILLRCASHHCTGE